MSTWTESDAVSRRAHDAVVGRLLADAAPVRPLWPLRVRLAGWLLLALTLILGVSLTHGLPDLAAHFADPWFVSQVAGVLLAAGWTTLLALRAAIPGRAPGSAELALVGTMAVTALGLGFVQPPAEPAIDAATFIRCGLPCVVATLQVALLPWLALMLALRRAAPVDARVAGALAGAAALLLASAALRMACPLTDERWHLLTWHQLPVIPGAMLSAALGWTWLRRWRRPQGMGGRAA